MKNLELNEGLNDVEGPAPKSSQCLTPNLVFYVNMGILVQSCVDLWITDVDLK
jgi:hypothetical protein